MKESSPLLIKRENVPFLGFCEDTSHLILSAEPDDKILFVPLAWNFYKEIRERIKKVRDNEDDMFLKYFPKVILESK